MAESEFKLPEGMEVDEDEIHERMLQRVPRNYDVSEGSLVFDVTRPTAEEKSRMINFNLSIVLQMMFPQFAEGAYLDYHGESFRIYRHPAEKATGVVSFHGDPGTEIPIGTIVMTASGGDDPPIQFETTEAGIINDDGMVDLPVVAVEPGIVGNVPADTIVAIEESISGLSSIRNENQMTDGADVEEDERYRERVLDQRRNRALSGARKDYRSWALEVEGVGDAVVIPEADDFGSGTTRVLITPREGGIASQELIDAVQQYIAPDGRNGGGLAPIGAFVDVGTVEQVPINITFSYIEYARGASKDEAFLALEEDLQKYFSDLSSGGTVRHTRVGSIAVGTGLIRDYDGLELNGQSGNIELTRAQIATVGEVGVKGEK